MVDLVVAWPLGLLLGVQAAAGRTNTAMHVLRATSLHGSRKAVSPRVSIASKGSTVL